MDTMRTGQMFGVSDMRCVEMAIPELRDGEMLVKTDMASICGSDLHLVCHGAGLTHPFPCPHGYPGHEAVGEVVDPGTTDVEAGTKVLCFPAVVPGMTEGFAEFQRIRPEFTLPLPSGGVSDAELLMAQQLGTVIFASRKRPVDMVGRTALVIGQGSAGLFWSYLLKRQGAAQVVVADLSPARLAASPGFGADVVINSGEEDLEAAIADLTGGVGADYVIEAVGRREVLYQSIELVKVDGDLMWFGLPDSDDSVPISYAKFFRKRLTATSTYGAQNEADAVSFQTALDLISGGHIDVSPLLSHVYPVDEIDTAFTVANEPADAGALKVSVSF